MNFRGVHSKFITFEGIDCCGKTTIQNELKSTIKDRYPLHYFLFTKEPGNGNIGQQIRQVLLNSDNTDMHPVAELLLYGADRAQHVGNVILPFLSKDNHIVISDRFKDSTIAYQHYGRGTNINLIESINNIADGNLTPDLTIILDMDVEKALKRGMKDLDTGIRDITLNRFENEHISFHNRVREGYLTLAKTESRFKVINADQSIERVFIECFNCIKQCIGE